MFNLSNIIYLVIAVVLSMSIHETAHGLVSYWMGDPTAKIEGRLSLILLNMLTGLDLSVY